MKQEETESDILEDLDELDKAIIRLKLEGVKDIDIADKLERNRQTIGRRLKKVKVQKAIDEFQKNALQILIDTQSDAARELRRILKTGTDDNKIKAAKEILKGVLSDNMNLSLTDNKFERKVFISGFLRGLRFINNYAIVNTSLDRHDKDFKEYELGKTLEEKNTKGKCGVWIIDMDTFDIIHTLFFTGDIKELYDVEVIPNSDRGRVIDFNDRKTINKFIL